MRFTVSAALALLSAVAAPVAAQTFTSCDPTNATCPADPALGTNFNQTYNSGSSLDPRLWNQTADSATFTSDGAQFTIVNSGDSTTYQTNFYIFFGRVEVWMQAAQGVGIISSLVLLSDDLDEIDWEIMGANDTYVENNYYGKGNRSEMNAKYAPCNAAPGNFHNYTVYWTNETVEWHLDGQVVRTLSPEEGAAGGGFPQTPAHFNMGVWAAGDPSQPAGTRAWAGGTTDYSKGPFTMAVRNVTITDFQTNATSYMYGDNSGDWQSIQIQHTEGQQSVAAQVVNAPPPETTAEQWQGLSSGAKIAIIAVPSGVLAILAIVGAFCCVKQRALGRRERAIEDAQWEKSTAEMMAYRRHMAGGRFAQGPEYRPVQRSY